MNEMKHTYYLIDAILAAMEAGTAIMEVYETDFDVEIKSDQSPLTLADKNAHEIIKNRLARHTLPAISEEGRHIDYQQRCAWPQMWIIDPLDGTKEFVKRNGEFTVNIALVEKQQPVMGVVYAPVLDWLYFASSDLGAFKLIDAKKKLSQLPTIDADSFSDLIAISSKLPVGQQPDRPYTIVGSRSHGTPELEQFVKAKREEKGDISFKAAGSSLKICLVAEGVADIYPRLGPTMEWDTAAGQAIVECAGARMYTFQENTALVYNKQDLLNPWFVVERQ